MSSRTPHSRTTWRANVMLNLAKGEVGGGEARRYEAGVEFVYRLRQFGVTALASRKLIRVVGEERVDAEFIKKVLHLLAYRFECHLVVVGLEGPRRDGHAERVRRFHHLGMTRDDDLLRRHAVRKLR